MKRSPMPQRRTPLRALKPLRRAARQQAVEYRHLRALVHAREGGSCAMCGRHTPITEGHCHHRLLRAQGGQDDAWTCVWLCADDHRFVHLSPDASYHTGWLVPMGVDPASWPIHRRSGWQQPTPDGWEHATPHERQGAA